MSPALISVTDAGGNTTRFIYDCDAGSLLSIAEVIRPLGNIPYRQDVAAVTLDGKAFPRVISQTDAYGNTTTLAYAEDATRVTETRPDGKTVIYEHYGNNGVPKGITDPEGIVTFPDEGTLAITREAAGNIIRRQYEGGPDLTFAYDALDRLVSTEGTAFTRDAEGRITAMSGGDTRFSAYYDDAGSLLATTGYHSAFTVTYGYDTGENGTGLLTAVSDDLTGTRITFAYDDDGRLRTVTLSNGEVITSTWDNADRLTRLQSGAHVDISFGYDASGRITERDVVAPPEPDGISFPGCRRAAPHGGIRLRRPGPDDRRAWTNLCLGRCLAAHVLERGNVASGSTFPEPRPLSSSPVGSDRPAMTAMSNACVPSSRKR